MKPKLRPIEVVPIEHNGQPMLLLRDPLQLSDASIALPRQLGPLLALMDGSRDEAALEAALLVRYGVRTAPGLLGRLVEDLSSAFVLEDECSRTAKAQALEAYRSAPYRTMTMAGGLAGNGSEAAAWLQSMIDALPRAERPESDGAVRGIVSPHIDYERGGAVYAEVWQAATEAAREAELVVLFGTDHCGGEGTLTLTRQSYATPWGVLPTELHLTDELAGALGADLAYVEELHHRREHSIELAAVWLHHVRQGKSVPVLPILCGSFAGFVHGDASPATHGPFARALRVLARAMEERRTLVVAAADLAHVGPAFGDAHGLDGTGRARLRRADERLLAAAMAADAEGFFAQIKAEGDRRHVCGVPPIYLTLRLLGGARGEAAGYAMCPADAEGMSYVSIAGVLLRQGDGKGSGAATACPAIAGGTPGRGT